VATGSLDKTLLTGCYQLQNLIPTDPSHTITKIDIRSCNNQGNQVSWIGLLINGSYKYIGPARCNGCCAGTAAGAYAPFDG
jgi:hypothetical protein